MAIDNSGYFELADLLLKPLTEDFRWPWSYIRTFFWGILPLTILSLVAGWLMGPNTSNAVVRDFFFNLAFISGILLVILYVICAFQAYMVHLDRLRTKALRGRKFQE